MSETPPTPFDDQHDSSGHPNDHPNLPGLDELVDSGWEPHSEEASQLLASAQKDATAGAETASGRCRRRDLARDVS